MQGNPVGDIALPGRRHGILWVTPPMDSRTQNVHLRPAVASDAGVIARFNARMAEETEHLTLDPGRLLAGVRAILGDPAKGFYTLAEVDGHVAGQTMITFEWSDWRNANFWWIQSVYVKPEFRGRGVYRALYRHIEEQAREKGACGLRLYVERENTRARETYRRCGMNESPYLMYEVDYVVARGGK